MKKAQPNGSPSVLIPALIGVLLAALLILFCMFFISPWDNSEPIDTDQNQEYNITIPNEEDSDDPQLYRTEPTYGQMDEELRQGEPEG